MNDVSSVIGLRYLRSKESNAFLSVITFLSVAGIALGVATLIVTLSMMVYGKSRAWSGLFYLRVYSQIISVA